MTYEIDADVLGKLRAAKEVAKGSGEVHDIIVARDEVLARYSPMFQPQAIAQISEDALRSFLYFENNKHWTGLNRQVNRVCADMPATRQALVDLVDETQPIETRMERAAAIKGMGKGIITAILHVAYPDRYGVWNNTSDATLVELGLMPTVGRGARFGERYAAINRVMVQVATAIDVDLWTLDALWWRLLDKDELDDDLVAEEVPGITASATAAVKRSFALERHLHDYLFDHWENLSLASEWDIYSSPSDPQAGYEFSTPIGRIDLLARHKTAPRWLVIELKRHGSSDQVVGQVLRYIGWIKAHHASAGEMVEGLVVAAEGDSQLHYAISAVPGLSFKSYEVKFTLNEGPSFEEFAKP